MRRQNQWSFGRIWSIMVVGLLAPVAAADNDFAPTWRGQAGSLTAEFDLWAGFYNPPPDGFFSGPDQWSAVVPSGASAVASPEAERVSAGTLNLFPRFQLVQINAADGLLIKVHNYVQALAPLRYRLQLTYRNHTPTEFALWPSWGTGGTQMVISATDHLISQSAAKPDGWITAAYEFELAATPEAATIGLRFDEYPALVDQIVIDTLRLAPIPTTCTEVWQLNYGLTADINHDCRVDLLDLALLAQSWLRCNDPQDDNCTPNW